MLNLIDRKTKVLLIVYITIELSNKQNKSYSIFNAVGIREENEYYPLLDNHICIFDLGQILLVLYCLSGLFMFCSVRSNGYIYIFILENQKYTRSTILCQYFSKTIILIPSTYIWYLLHSLPPRRDNMIMSMSSI